ncbi:putative D-aminoacylase [Nemania diffusa]|nr:putative D-aminoacylase [Nemania diffusa]
MLLGRLQALGPVIGHICEIAGTPGLSLGVLYHGEVIHQANFGLRDVEAHLPPDENTIYVLGSLTKAVTAAMVAILVDEGKLSWITQLQHVIPTFRRPNYDPTRNITISDLLSHRTGLPSYDSFWLQSDNQAPILRKDAVSILSYVPVAADLRTELIYNNLAYEVLGQVIETVSSTSFSSFLTNHILKPLGMNQTFYTSPPTSYRNIAKAYTTLQNTSVLSLPAPIYGEGVLMGPAGGIRSSVHDLLILYSAFIDAANSQIEKHRATIPDNPLKQLGHLWQGLIAVPLSTVREASYASGWLRVQLPAPMGMGSGPGVDPMLGEGLPSRLGLFHEGNIPGYTTFTAVFPETSSAVVVLSNSLGLTDSARLVGQLLIEALFGNTVNTTDYIEYASSTARESASAMAVIRQQLVQGRTVKSPTNPLKAYVGIYYNSINTFCIEISEGNGHLRVHFMGRKYEGFKLQPYQHNSFFWHLSYDELAQRARYTTYPKEYYVIEFNCIDDPEGDPAAYDVECKMMNALRWKHEFTIQGKGEIFYRKDHNEEPFDQNMAQAVFNNEL